MRLLPSQIRYSQDSISNTLSEGEFIGEVLDDLCYGRIQKRDFPVIEVARIGRKWYTADNRRLWIFRKLEELGRCRRIPVEEIYEIPDFKMTTRNGGKDIAVRGYPGGYEIENLGWKDNSANWNPGGFQIVNPGYHPGFQIENPGYHPSSCLYEQFSNFRI